MSSRSTWTCPSVAADINAVSPLSSGAMASTLAPEDSSIRTARALPSRAANASGVSSVLFLPSGAAPSCSSACTTGSCS
eukprot:2391479-Prymnesium_polylepis.1